ncbi:MAG TPA: type II toxin-antitoxin system antitoxin SocA domain-containing protein [Candidatus Paceibacterota bacterium]
MLNSAFIKKSREKRKLSQEYVAKQIGVSRPTFSLIESGETEPTLSQAEKLATVLDISLQELLRGEYEKIDVVEKKLRKREEKKGLNFVPEERISVPQERENKFKQVLLYIIAKVGGKPNVGQTVLYKLLYFMDFDYYERYEEQLIGARYMKNTYGPTPVIFQKIVSDLEQDGKLETVKSKFYKHEQKKYLVSPAMPVDVSALSAQELAHIDWELNRLSDMTATQISALSHIDTPWVVAKDREYLDYESVFYRPDETSVREYEPL